MQRSLLLTREYFGQPWGVKLAASPGSERNSLVFTVHRILAGSPAEGRLFPGDQVLELDDRPLAHVSHNQVLELLSQPKNSLRCLVFRQGGGGVSEGGFHSVISDRQQIEVDDDLVSRMPVYERKKIFSHVVNQEAPYQHSRASSLRSRPVHFQPVKLVPGINAPQFGWAPYQKLQSGSQSMTQPAHHSSPQSRETVVRTESSHNRWSTSADHPTARSDRKSDFSTRDWRGPEVNVSSRVVQQQSAAPPVSSGRAEPVRMFTIQRTFGPGGQHGESLRAYEVSAQPASFGANTLPANFRARSVAPQNVDIFDNEKIKSVRAAPQSRAIYTSNNSSRSSFAPNSHNFNHDWTADEVVVKKVAPTKSSARRFSSSTRETDLDVWSSAPGHRRTPLSSWTEPDLWRAAAVASPPTPEVVVRHQVQPRSAAMTRPGGTSTTTPAAPRLGSVSTGGRWDYNQAGNQVPVKAAWNSGGHSTGSRSRTAPSRVVKPNAAGFQDFNRNHANSVDCAEDLHF